MYISVIFVVTTFIPKTHSYYTSWCVKNF